ncbi:MAG TPA: exodeoxyribonuclease VII large subunit [Roseiarcus sp.]|nr:exodeoxyribonuclease VII large subunit [Roseiarcus sp.]
MVETEAAPTNAPEISVSELSNALKRTLEDRFSFVRVRGEVSNYRGPHSSGHVYFSLKDQNARIDAVIWRSTFARMRIRPEEGLEVIAAGKITTFPGKSAYQIVIESLEPAGVGALMALMEARRVKLAAEGLFDTSRKKPLPYLPRVVGVVTSPTGAVIRDILHRLADRFPSHVLVWPVRVQGETSAREVADAISGFNALDPLGAIERPDVLIVARGGGSLEDLWGFNDEIVVRAAAASLIPLVSAVGHETDTTLIDHVADIRAPTPTAAAELVVPVRAELIARVARDGGRLTNGALRLGERRRAELRALARALPSGEALLASPRQRLDRAGGQMATSLRAAGDRRRIALERMSRRLAAQSPRARMARAHARLEGFSERLKRAGKVDRERRAQSLARVEARLRAALAARARLGAHQAERFRERVGLAQERLRRAIAGAIEQRDARLDALDQFLGALSYRSVLKRGFALVRDHERLPLRSAAAVSAGKRLSIEFADGEASAVAEGGPSLFPSRSRKRAPKEKNSDQGVLF